VNGLGGMKEMRKWDGAPRLPIHQRLALEGKEGKMPKEANTDTGT
jgi:hypothetical protein